MWVQETEKAYICHRECDANIPQKEKKTYKAVDGLRATFGMRKNGNHILSTSPTHSS